ncbi:unnamed protein product [Rhizophagus irregularis]|nr:unnamed protein product [Rhizophagus irregularis]CAB5103969.1 unnamed protein product [Rhizophagus irregularis]
MSFDDIKIHAATAIAKSGDATYMNFVDFMNIHLQCPYGFAQLCSFKRLADLDTFEMNAITVRIVEPIPILTFKEYLKSILMNLRPVISKSKFSSLHHAQARLVKDSSGVTAKRTTDPHLFYSLGDKQTNLKKEVKRRIFSTETNAESKYTIYNKSRPKRTVAANFNDIEANSWRSKRESKRTKLAMINCGLSFC